MSKFQKNTHWVAVCHFAGHSEIVSKEYWLVLKDIFHTQNTGVVWKSNEIQCMDMGYENTGQRYTSY